MTKVYEINLKTLEKIIKDEFDTFNITLYRCHRFASLKCKELMNESEYHYHVVRNEDGYDVECYETWEKLFRYEVGE